MFSMDSVRLDVIEYFGLKVTLPSHNQVADHLFIPISPPVQRLLNCIRSPSSAALPILYILTISRSPRE